MSSSAAWILHRGLQIWGLTSLDNGTLDEQSCVSRQSRFLTVSLRGDPHRLFSYDVDILSVELNWIPKSNVTFTLVYNQREMYSDVYNETEESPENRCLIEMTDFLISYPNKDLWDLWALYQHLCMCVWYTPTLHTWPTLMLKIGSGRQ